LALRDTIARIESFVLTGLDAGDVWGPAYGFVVKLTTADGIVGYGESDTMPAIAAAVFDAPMLNPLITGLRDLLTGTMAEPAAAWDLMRKAVIQYGRDGIVLHAMAAVDIALWDIAGKRAGKPVAELLGGARRDRLRCYGTHPLGETPEESAENARALVASGFDAVKFGWHPLGPDADRDEAIIRALREAVGADVDLLIDGGMAWDVPTAIARAARFRPYGIFWLEEPLPAYDMSGYASLRKSAGVSIAAGEMAASEAELSTLVTGGSVDILQIDVSRTGLSVGMRIAELGAAHGVAIVNHSYSHVINAAASLQLMAASPKVSLFECQTSPNEIRDALDGGQLRPERGWIGIPAGPGLGIEVDEQVLRHFSGERRKAS
jgi:L-alanine-DL-glutamate epimerase-like enolase superfamily enzyme